MAQFEKVGTEIYGNTAHDVDQRSYNPVAHESKRYKSLLQIYGILLQQATCRTARCICLGVTS
jgi:hypothetical protein